MVVYGSYIYIIYIYTYIYDTYIHVFTCIYLNIFKSKCISSNIFRCVKGMGSKIQNFKYTVRKRLRISLWGFQIPSTLHSLLSTTVNVAYWHLEILTFTRAFKTSNIFHTWIASITTKNHELWGFEYQPTSQNLLDVRDPNIGKPSKVNWYYRWNFGGPQKVSPNSPVTAVEKGRLWSWWAVVLHFHSNAKHRNQTTKGLEARVILHYRCSRLLKCKYNSSCSTYEANQ